MPLSIFARSSSLEVTFGVDANRTIDARPTGNLIEEMSKSQILVQLNNFFSESSSDAIRIAQPDREYPLVSGEYEIISSLTDAARTLRTKLFYMGEAENLVKRLLQPHGSIEGWDFFRYNALPQPLAPYRVAIERMLIRDFAAILKNKREIPWRDLAGCCLA